jgi:hypothetical protein
VGRGISAIEKQIVEAAEAMPEDKFSFSPESVFREAVAIQADRSP